MIKVNIIHSSMNEMSCNIHTDTMLEFENYWELNSNLLDADFVSDNEIEILEEDEDDNQAKIVIF